MLAPAQAAAVATAFGLAGPAILEGPVARGEQGQVWRLRVPGGCVAVKETFGPLEPDVVAESAAFQEAARGHGVPTPSVLRAPDGAVACVVGDAAVRAYGWAELGPPDRAADPAAVGRVLAGIHGCGFAGRLPQDPWYAQPVGAARWAELVDGLTAAAGPCAAELSALVPELVALEDGLAPPRDLATCHRDLWADNLLPVAGGGLCAIDWDDCGLAGPDQELALVAWEFWGGQERRAAALYRAYLAAGGPARIDGPGDLSMLVAQLGHIAEDAISTWLDTATAAAERARQAARIAEVVAAAPSRRAIAELAGALVAAARRPASP